MSDKKKEFNPVMEIVSFPFDAFRILTGIGEPPMSREERQTRALEQIAKNGKK